MKKLFLLTLLLCHSSAFSQDWLEDKENLKGNVKFIHYKSTKFLQDPDEKMKEDQQFYYNPKGFLTKSDIKMDFDEVSRWGVNRIYDSSGMHCLMEYPFPYEDTTTKRNFEYDSLGRVRQANYYSNGRYSTS